MDRKRLAGRLAKGLLAAGLTVALAITLVAEPATYAGVTFPSGDRAFADRVVDYVAASCVRDAYDDPVEALGPPDARDAGCDGCGGCTTNAVSLGFRLSVLDNRGYLVLEFTDNVLVDVPGPDLFVYITNDNPCRVEISSDGSHYVLVGETVGYPGAIDIAPFVGQDDRFHFVRLSDVPADEDHSNCPGSSIDAVGAMGPAEEVIVGEAFGSLALQPIGELSLSLDRAPNSIHIILDTSSSMADRIDGEIKIDVAKDVIIDLLGNLPEGSLVGFRSFGGCGSDNLVAPIGPLNRAALQSAVRQLGPGGATPIADTLFLARDDLAQIPDTKLILLVSDGMETCGGDPVEAARDLIRAGYDLRIHVVGFDIGQDASARDQLIAIAESTGGVYFDAAGGEELRRALSLAAPFSYAVYDLEGQMVFSGRLGEESPPQLPAGAYRVVIDTDPQIVLDNVIVEEQRTTVITVERANGGYQAEVGR